MRKKIKIKLILIVFGIVLPLLSISNYNNNDDQGIKKEKMEILDETNLKTADPDIDIITPEDKTYTEPMDGYYPATYSFDEEVGSLPAGWNGDDKVDCLSEIIEDKGGHSHVLMHYDVNSLGYAKAFTYVWPSRLSGIVEFYLRSTDVSKQHSFILGNISGWQTIINFEIYNSKFSYFNNSIHYEITPSAIASDTWYHISIRFRCTGGAALSSPDDDLDEGKWRVYINDIKYPDYYVESDTGLNIIYSGTNATQVSYTVYLDAVGYSWDNNYEIGDNLDEGLLLSFKNYTNIDNFWYSLDGQSNITISGNTTIPMPDDGQHTIQVFGNDTLGDIYESEVRYFTIGKPIIIDGGGNGGGNGGDKDNSNLMVIVIILLILAIVMVSAISTIVIKRQTKQLIALVPQAMKRGSQLKPKAKKVGDFRAIEFTEAGVLKVPLKKMKYKITVICPICKIKKQVRIPKSSFNVEKYITTVSIPKKAICEHHFQVFVDDHLNVRGYQKVDFEIISEKNHVKVVEDELTKIKSKFGNSINKQINDKKDKKVKKENNK